MKNLILIIISIFTFSLSAEEIVIAVENDAAPWSYGDGTGYANELVKLAYKAVGIDVKLDIMPYARCKSLTEKGEYIACFTTSKTSQTEKKLIFPKNSIINVRNILWVKKGKEISNCNISKWPKPLKVATTNQYEYVQKFDDYVKNKIISPIMINQETQGLSMVDYERVDAAIVTIDEVKTIEYVKLRAGLKINVVIGCDLGTLKGYISFSKKHKRSKILAEQFDKGIGIITKNGELKKLQLTWSK